MKWLVQISDSFEVEADDENMAIDNAYEEGAERLYNGTASYSITEIGDKDA
jgi:hypothetical protein